MRALDTSPEAAAIQEEIHRRLGSSGRLRKALELSDLAKAFAVVGMRLRHPQYSEKEAIRALAEQLYGRSGSVR